MRLRYRNMDVWALPGTKYWMVGSRRPQDDLWFWDRVVHTELENGGMLLPGVEYGPVELKPPLQSVNQVVMRV